MGLPGKPKVTKPPHSTSARETYIYVYMCVGFCMLFAFTLFSKFTKLRRLRLGKQAINLIKLFASLAAKPVASFGAFNPRRKKGNFYRKPSSTASRRTDVCLLLAAGGCTTLSCLFLFLLLFLLRVSVYPLRERYVQVPRGEENICYRRGRVETECLLRLFTLLVHTFPPANMDGTVRNEVNVDKEEEPSKRSFVVACHNDGFKRVSMKRGSTVYKSRERKF